jgi:hypothetical protein
VSERAAALRGTEETLLGVGIEQTLAAELDSTAPRGIAGSSAAAPLPVGGERFRVGAELGRGGMGRVVEAVDRQFDRVVALKEVLPDGGASAHERFVVEALVTGNLEHPGIPSVYERGTRDGVPFYAMRRVQGKTLSALLAGARTPEERLRLLPVVVQVAQTLGYAHDRGVVHRDVKPDNVLVGPHGEAVVLDWGIAKVRGLRAMRGADAGAAVAGAAITDGSSATVQGAVIGTPSYMAPEQAAGRVDAIDARTDVFQLGALLYELLSGRPPYEGATTMAVVLSASLAQFAPLRDAAPKAPHALAAICEKAMAREPEARFEDGNALAAALGGMMLDAVTHRDHGASRWIATGITAAAALLAMLATVAIFLASPTFREGGAGSYFVVALAGFSLALSFLEWRTRGALELSGVALALVGATTLLGVAATCEGFVRVFDKARELTGDERAALLVDGAYEAITSVVLAMPLAALALLAWALVRRSVAQTA